MAPTLLAVTWPIDKILDSFQDAHVQQIIYSQQSESHWIRSQAQEVMDQTQVVTLNRLLTRLDRTIATNDALLKSSSHDRARTSANIDYARTLLLALEKQASTVRVQSQRQSIQADLQSKRETIKRISAALQACEKAGAEQDSDRESEDDDAAEEGGRQDTWGPARQDTDAGLDTGEHPQPLVTSHQTASELRPRRGGQHSALQNTGQTSARENLFAGRPKDSSSSTNLSTHEAVLTHNRQQQETLTSSLVSLAQQLKQSSQAFNSSLASEKEVLARAEGGLENSSKSMEAAERRMGTLRRMSEGQGWLGRLKLYGMIAGLWVACFLIVFVGPKLRF